MADAIDAAKVEWDAPVDASQVQWDSAEKPVDPTEGMSARDKFMAGAGKVPLDLWRGVRQIYGDMQDIVSGHTLVSAITGEPSHSAAVQQEIDNSAERDKPLLQTGAGLAGNIAGNVATSVIPAGLAGDAARLAGLSKTGAALKAISNPTTLGSAMASGAIQGGTAPVETGGSRLWNTTAGSAGGAAGNIVARGAGAITSAVSSAIEDAGSRAVKALQDAGVPLDAAQRTGSILLQRAKAMLSDNPLTAGAQKHFQDAQNASVTKAFLRTIGSSADSATPEVMGKAKAALSKQYDDAFSKLSLPYDKIEPHLADLVDNARLSLNDQQFGVIQRNAEDLMTKAAANDGMINGKQFQNIKTTLDRLSGGADQQVGDVARDMREMLHDGLVQHAADTGNEAIAQQLKTTNQQWRNMRTLEGAISKDGNGIINPSTVANVMHQKANRATSIYGQGDTTLADLAHAANDLLPLRVNQSGTIPRLVAMGTLPAAVAAGEGLYSGDWKKAAEYGAGAFALPKAAQILINAQGPVARGATRGIAALAKPVTLPALAGGALQHLPVSALLSGQQALEDQPDKSPLPSEQKE